MKRKFSSFSYDEALQHLGIDTLQPWVLDVAELPLSSFFERRLKRLDGFELNNSERGKELLIDAFCEEILERHPKLKIWKEAPLATIDTTGFVDYLIAPRRAYLAAPLLCVIEAKKDKFDTGTAQCLIGMVACSEQNAQAQPQHTGQHTAQAEVAATPPITTVHGIVSNGQIWQFLRLWRGERQQVWQTAPYTVREPSELLGALDHVFAACESLLVA
jgi:hypothetical protein